MDAPSPVDQLIFIKGGAYVDVKKAAGAWLGMYEKELPSDFKIDLYKNGRGCHVVKVDSRMSNLDFFFLINYLYYPFDIEYKINATGYTTGDADQPFAGLPVMVYIPPDDSSHDFVMVATNEGNTFKVDVNNNIHIAKSGLSFVPFDDFQLGKPERVKAQIPASEQFNDHTFFSSVKQRIITLAILTVLAIAAGILQYEYFEEAGIASILGFGVGYWFFADYKMLQTTRFYLAALMLATIVYAFGYLMNIGPMAFEANGFLELSSGFPVLVLIIQLPMRLIFKRLINREPVVDRDANSAVDFIYSALFITSVILTALAIYG